jgi:hypothetical protein
VTAGGNELRRLKEVDVFGDADELDFVSISTSGFGSLGDSLADAA